MAKDPLRYFRIEARELHEGLSRGVLELEKRPGDRPRLQELQRLAHTLKGASRVVRQAAIAGLAHELESVLAPFREGDAQPGPAQFEALLRLLDEIGAAIASLDPVPAPARSAATVEEPFESVRVPVQELDQLLRQSLAAAVQAQGLRRPLSQLEQARELAVALQDQLESPRLSAAVAGSAGRRLLALAEELRRGLERARRGLASGLEHAEVELAQVRDSVDQLRLLPAGAAFGTLERAVRDAASSLERRVELETSGAEIKLDAHVLAALRDAMLQLVRNAVAHGIEPPRERESLGKPPAGRVTVAFERRGPRVAFICKDDGRGLDLHGIEAEARRRGLLAEGQPLDAEGAGELLLRGGLTTSREVTPIAGRGIGLDLVRETVRRLKGEATLRSTPGQGTTVELRVPVSLSSARALFVEAAEARICVPLDAVSRALQVRAEQVAVAGGGESILHEGRVLPFARLAQVLGRPPAQPPRRTWPTLILEAGGRAAALAVDRLVGSGEVIVRLLPALVQAEPVVAGAALEADGTPRLVLDALGVIEAASRLGVAAPEASPRAARRVLVIDDSLTTRMLEQSILESAGFQVELASSGEEALARARASRHDLFLVDIEMPGIDGFEFIRLSREDPLLQGTPSILVSSRSSPEDQRRGAEVGAKAYIVKSDFDQGALLREIRGLVP